MADAAVPAADAPRFGRRSVPNSDAPTGLKPYAEHPLKASGLPQSCPRWGLQTKQRTEHDRKAQSRSELRNGFGGFYSSGDTGGKVGKRCAYQSQRGPTGEAGETQWRVSVKMVPGVERHDKPVGKSRGYAVPGSNGGEIRMQQRSHFEATRCDKEVQMLQSRSKIKDESGQVVQDKRGKEASAETMMTRKRVTHSSEQARNGMPFATLGDKPYADPTYSSGYWRDAASTVPKCAVEQVDRRPPPPNLPKLREFDLALQAERADVAAVPSLPQGAPRYDIRVPLPRKEVEDLLKVCVCDGGEVTILRPPSDAAATVFSNNGLSWARGGGEGAVSDFPIALLRVNGEAVRDKKSIDEALQRAPAGEVEIHCGNETGDAGLDSP